MASVCITTNPMSEIGYSLIDGEVVSFDLLGTILYDKFDDINIDGWMDKLISFIEEQGLNIENEKGLFKFVYYLSDKKLIKIIGG